MRKYREHTDEFIKTVLEYKKNHSYTETTNHFNIPRGTIVTWVYKKRSVEPRKTKGCKSVTKYSVEERYEIIKKFIDFLEQQENKN